MNSIVIGRRAELSLLEEAYQSNRAEFMAVYGRRRVGKTFLIREFFSGKPECQFFQISGIKDATLKEQLDEFKKEIVRVFYSNLKMTKLEAPKNWLAAFEMLQEAITLFGGHKKIALFFDEFPWMAQRKSKLLHALDYYWNRYWSSQKNIKLIICGSAASWIIKNILNHKGGLHNRVTRRMLLNPFTLQETKAYLKNRGITYDNYQTVQLYMCIGGIPYYLDMLRKGLSSAQNINQLCFQREGSLFDEFNNLFKALFDQGGAHEDIIRMIAGKREGISRDEIVTTLSIKGGTLSIWLKELEQTGFIESFMPIGRKYGRYYKIIDEYTLFYLNWIAPLAQSGLQVENITQYWEEASQTPGWRAWAGLAFEAICYKHISSIRKALHIPQGALAATWRYTPPKRSSLPGAQVDLLFDRNDGVVSLCEMKYANAPFKIDKDYASILERKKNVYQHVTKTQKQIVISMITTLGLKSSDYAEDLIFSSCTLEDLFE